MPKFTFTFLSIFSALAILLGSLLNVGSVSKSSYWLGEDKLLHMGAYFWLSTATFLAFALDWKKTHAHATVFILCFTYGMTIELAQEQWTNYRSGDVYDLLANTVGIVLALFLGKTVKKIVNKSRIFLN